jgi:hypothetical protein
MDFESVADELYALAREEFTATREERVRQARGNGDRELAGRIHALRKPTAAAWLLNQLARRFESELGRLDELGAALRKAHGAVAGEDLRALSKQRHQLVQELTERARWLGRKEGLRLSDAVTTQLQGTFEAALSDPEAAAELRSGRLHTALEPTGGEQWLAAALAAGTKTGAAGRREKKAKDDRIKDDEAKEKVRTTRASGRRPKKAEEPAEKGTGERPDRKKRDAERRRHELREARAAVRAADEQRTQARRELGDAEHAAAEVAQRISELREQLDDAERSERDARREVAAARRRARQAERAAELAEKTLADRD